MLHVAEIAPPPESPYLISPHQPVHSAVTRVIPGPLMAGKKRYPEEIKTGCSKRFPGKRNGAIYVIIPAVKTLLILIFLLIPSLSAASIEVFVSVLPQKLFVERIGGDRVHVRVMVNKGYNPATYQPTTRQIAELANADLYVRTGIPFEESWMPRISAANSRMKILDLRDGISLLSLAHEHGDHNHDLDPHVWTDPLLVKEHIVRLRDVLSEVRPDLAGEFSANQVAFAEELDLLHQDINRKLKGSKGKAFFVFHPAWGYLAKRYGLQQIAAEYEGKEPTARQMALMIEQAKAAQASVIFVQPQFSMKTARVLANEIGARVEEADPLAENYIETMRKFATRLVGREG